MSKTERGLTAIGRTIPRSGITTRNIQHPRWPSQADDIFERIDEDHILLTISDWGWATYIRREGPHKYAIRFRNEDYELSGVLSLTHGQTRRLVEKKWYEAVWGALRPRTAWPTADECMEGDS